MELELSLAAKGPGLYVGIFLYVSRLESLAARIYLKWWQKKAAVVAVAVVVGTQ